MLRLIVVHDALKTNNSVKHNLIGCGLTGVSSHEGWLVAVIIRFDVLILILFNSFVSLEKTLEIEDAFGLLQPRGPFSTISLLIFKLVFFVECLDSRFCNQSCI